MLISYFAANFYRTSAERLMDQRPVVAPREWSKEPLARRQWSGLADRRSG